MATLAAMGVSERPLRADAERNRRRILDVARRLFAERGLSITLDDVAREAGLGVGTVYRRFASREALVEALFEERMDEIVAIADEALELADPWEALTTFLERTMMLQATDRGLKELVLGSSEGRDRVIRMRARMRPRAEALVRRAQEAGALRADFAPQDLPLLQIMIGAIVDASATVAPDLWRRLLGLLLDGMRASGTGSGLPAPPLDFDELARVMHCWRPPQRRAD